MPHKILIFEPHPYHYDELTSITYCFHKLNYNIDIFVQSNCNYEDIFVRCDFKDEINFEYYNPKEMRLLLENERVSEYDFIFFTSLDYFHDNKKERLFDFLGFVPKSKYGILGIYHNMNIISDDDIVFIKEGRIFGLSPFVYKGYKIKLFSPSYFGNLKEKKECVNNIFSILMIGASNNRREAEYSYVKLKYAERRNIVIGDIGKHDIVKELYSLIRLYILNMADIMMRKPLIHKVSLKGFLKIKKYGFVNFSRMYDLIEDADFILICMNPEIITYKPFLFGKTSGAKLLSIAFKKPCIIQKQFACSFGFDENNSVIYELELENALKRVCKMERNEYNKLCKNMERLSEEVFKDSLENLQDAIRNNSIMTS